MAEVKGSPALNKQTDKHNTGICYSWIHLSCRTKAPLDARPPSAGGNGPDLFGPGQGQLPPRPPLSRVDSRSSFPPQTQPPRPGGPQQFQQQQQRPQFQPGGPVTNPPQYVPRPGTPAPRGPLPAGPPGQPQARPQPPPIRSVGPQSFAPQQGPRPLQSPTSGQPPQRIPAPSNLQFGPRQPPQLGTAATPDGARPQFIKQPNGVPRTTAPIGPGPLPAQPPKLPLQGSLRAPDSPNSYQNKPVNLDNLNYTNGGQNATKPENVGDMPGVPKNRSYSIAAAPGAPSPLKMEDDRRKSVSALGGRMDDFTSRTPGLGLIQEGKIDSKDNVRGSKESVRSEASHDGSKDITDRPDSRLSGSKMTDSFVGSLPSAMTKKNFDDNDDVVLQNSAPPGKAHADISQTQNQSELFDRSPSLTRSDESPELKQNISSSAPPIKPQSITSEPQRPKTPKSETNQDSRDPKSSIVSNKPQPKSPIQETKQVPVVNKKPSELNTTLISADSKKSTPRKTASAPKHRQKDGDNDSGVDEFTQGNDLNGSPGSPNKKLPSKLPTKEKSNTSIKQSLSRSSSKSATAKTPENPLPPEKKKVPMNKIQVGNAPSPNIKAVKSKIGSLENATYKPGGGKIKIENKKLEFGNVTPRIAAKNEAYLPSGGAKKITTTKLEWNAKSKIGSLQNTSYKPGGGDKKIETVKLDFKEKAKPKVASTVNITHKPGGGAVKATVAKNGAKSIENQKLEFKAQSKVGSLDNVKYKPGGGDIKIFDDKDYIKQINSPVPGSLGHSRQEDYYPSVEDWAAEELPLSRCRSARAPRTPRALSPRKAAPAHDDADAESRILRNNERNRRTSTRPVSARDPPRSACSRRSSVLGQRPPFTVY